MPIYEFYCKKCNTMYQFFSRTINTETIPKCPSCKKPKLERMMSGFATISESSDESESSNDIPDIDDATVQKAMSLIEKNLLNVDVDNPDPRQTTQLMKDLSSMSGLEMGEGMQEALSRLEKGEDPEKIEQEMGNILKDEDQFFKKTSRAKKRSSRPRKDETLYDLE
ncbi:MAG TPA: zinc ribbon domain-containing protein [Thermodesulfobacteriota bacterium]|nr:zinc ribbon domain-containing protein [Thermodesulfobacteriota bacterium]